MCEIHISLDVRSENLWAPVNRADFGNWLQSNGDELVAFTHKNLSSFSSRSPHQQLKCLYQDQITGHVQLSDITYLKPLFNLQTLSYNDIEIVIDDFYQKYIVPTGRQFAVVVGDFQVWEKLFLLHVRQPVKYQWLIPMPGEWHWTWHIIIAIYKVYYDSILLPFAKLLGFLKLDPKAVNFHYAEDLLQMVTIAIHAWIVFCLAANPTLTPI